MMAAIIVRGSGTDSAWLSLPRDKKNVIQSSIQGTQMLAKLSYPLLQQVPCDGFWTPTVPS